MWLVSLEVTWVDRYVIRGGNRLKGAVRLSGAKNATLPLLAACLLTADECRIHGAPDLRDVEVMTEILRRLGASVTWHQDGGNGQRHLRVSAACLITYEVHEYLMREMRSSIFLMGPLLGRLGRVRVSYPGGCAIGPRPIDFHLQGLIALGAKIREKYGFIYAETDCLTGCEIHLDFPSVGATENLMMAAVLARGTTVIRNAAKEPEIVDLQNFLNGIGARVKGAGTDVIRIEGVESLGGTDHTVIPDRIEAGTFMAAAAATGGDVKVEGVIPEHVEAITAKLREAGATVEEDRDTIRVQGPERLKAVDVKTLPYPGFPTDMQPQIMTLMAVAEGTSIITETVFENRFSQSEELRRMGAHIKTDGRTAVVKGVEALSGAVVEARDLRSGAGLVLAGLIAEGVTMVEGVHHLDRGYESIDRKLTLLGADIRRVTIKPKA